MAKRYLKKSIRDLVDHGFLFYSKGAAKRRKKKKIVAANTGKQTEGTRI